MRYRRSGEISILRAFLRLGLKLLTTLGEPSIPNLPRETSLRRLWVGGCFPITFHPWQFITYLSWHFVFIFSSEFAKKRTLNRPSSPHAPPNLHSVFCWFNSESETETVFRNSRNVYFLIWSWSWVKAAADDNLVPRASSLLYNIYQQTFYLLSDLNVEREEALGTRLSLLYNYVILVWEE